MRRFVLSRGEQAFRALELRGEEIYDELFDTGRHGLLSEIKECFEGAIALAHRDGLLNDVRRLRARLDSIMATCRRRFS